MEDQGLVWIKELIVMCKLCDVDQALRTIERAPPPLPPVSKSGYESGVDPNSHQKGAGGIARQ